MSSSVKSREQKEKAILEAVGRIFIREGFTGIGINSIATEAECSKVLIYRYFGGLDGLLEQFTQRFKLIEVPQFKSDIPIKTQMTAVFSDQITSLRKTPLLREIMKWEIVDTNPLTKAMANEREASGMSIINKFTEESDADIPALAAIISAGISYLSIRSDSVDSFCGIDLNSDEGWSRIENAISSLITNLDIKEKEL